MLCNISKERKYENPEACLLKKENKKKADKGKTKPNFPVYVVFVANVLGEIVQLLESHPSRASLKTALSHLPANGQPGEQGPEDRSEVAFKGKDIDGCKCVRPFVF